MKKVQVLVCFLALLAIASACKKNDGLTEQDKKNSALLVGTWDFVGSGDDKKEVEKMTNHTGAVYFHTLVFDVNGLYHYLVPSGEQDIINSTKSTWKIAKGVRLIMTESATETKDGKELGVKAYPETCRS